MTSVQSETVAAMSAALGNTVADAPWMAALRQNAATAADRLAMPDSRRERPWKYLDVSNLRPESFGTSGAERIDITADASQATVVEFKAATGETASAIEKNLSSAVLPGISRLTALHYALLRGGVVAHVPANSEVAEPVRIRRSYSGSQFAAPHTLIVTGANSRVTIVQEYFSGDDEMVATPVVEIIPGPGSQVRLYSIHRWGAKTQVFESQRYLAEADAAELQSLNIVLGGQVVKSHLESSLIGRGSASEMLGLCYGKGRSHADMYTVQDHIGPDTRSDLLVKSALTESARAVYYGLTRVGLGAKNADANQENRNLLLSKTAKADSDPVLEILTNDVIRVSHGATAGPVDQEQLFYMQARGIPYAEAESMLVTAFLEDVLGRVPDETLRQELTDLLEEALD
ncbi:MAG: SufD family Fe-S cluster assembly protein [Dehalococcoidia bacterium]